MMSWIQETRDQYVGHINTELIEGLNIVLGLQVEWLSVDHVYHLKQAHYEHDLLLE